MKFTRQTPIDVTTLGPAPAVILCRTQMGENIGASARGMLNFGLSAMRLVQPDCGWPNAKAVASASGATAVLNGIELHDDVRGACHDIQHLFATTARPRGFTKPVIDAREAAQEMRRLVAQGRKVGLLFGPERSGLANDELVLADAIVSLPVNPDFSSLNLSQAVLLVAYEWWRTGDIAVPVRPDEAVVATKAQIDSLLGFLLAELDAVAFFQSLERRESLYRTIKLLFERRQLTEAEVNLLYGIFKQLARGGRARPEART